MNLVACSPRVLRDACLVERQVCSRVVELYLVQNKIGDVGAAAIGNALKYVNKGI